MKKIPAIISDIDGVLVRGKYPISKVKEALSFWKTPLQEIFQKSSPYKSSFFPMICLTNGGGMLEEEKGKSINDSLQLPVEKQLKGDQFLLNFSPLRPILAEKYKKKLVLLAGTGNINAIAKSCQLNNFILMEEFCALYPNQVEHFKRKRMSQAEALESIYQRVDEHHLSINLERSLQFDGIFVLNDPIYWEDCIQVIINQVYHSLSLPKPSHFNKRQVEIFTVNNDITYADTFRLNRIAFGPFTYCLQRVAKSLYNDTLDIKIYGKPSKLTYDYAKEELKKQSEDEIGNIYMIGDNPKSDIRGGNNNGCISILVRSGVFKGENDTEDPAQFVVDDFYEAVKLICLKEGIPFVQ